MANMTSRQMNNGGHLQVLDVVGCILQEASLIFLGAPRNDHLLECCQPASAGWVHAWLGFKKGNVDAHKDPSQDLVGS